MTVRETSAKTKAKIILDETNPASRETSERKDQPGGRNENGSAWERANAEGKKDVADVPDSLDQFLTLPAEVQARMFRRFWNWIKSIFKKTQPQPATNLLQKKHPEEIAEEEDANPNDQAMSRRNLMRGGIHFFAKPAVELVQNKIEQVNETVDKITRHLPLLRPPGAIPEKRFLETCTRCDACIHACPKDAIKRVPKKIGFLVAGTPYIEPLKSPCVMCDDLPCILACEDNALLPVATPAQVKMGYAIMDTKKCQTYGDIFCQQCVIDCPIPGAITQTQVDMKPIFHKNVCTGCGVCVHSCSTVNIPVAVKIKPQMVIESQRLEQLRDRSG